MRLKSSIGKWGKLRNLPKDGVVPWQYTSNSVVVVIVTCTFVCFNKKTGNKVLFTGLSLQLSILEYKQNFNL